MKKPGRKLLVGTLSLVFFACSCLTGFASNTATISKVTVDDDGQGTNATEYTEAKGNMGQIVVHPDQLITVEVKLTGESELDVSDAEATFLAFVAETQPEALSNDTIHYINQEAVKVSENEGTVTFTYRPRTGENWIKNFTANVGGTGVSQPATFSYTVKEADKEMTLKAPSESLTEGDGKDAIFTLTGYEGEQSGLKVTLNGNKQLTEDDEFTFEKPSTLTIKNKAFSDLGSGTFTVTVEVPAGGYTKAEASLAIAAKQEVTVPDADAEKVEAVLGELENQDSNVTGNEVQLPELKTEGDEHEGEYSITSEPDSEIKLVDDEQGGKKVVYTPDPDTPKFAHRVVVKADFGTTDSGEPLATEKVFYFVKESVTLSFGNVTAVAAGDEVSDAFESQANLQSADPGDLVVARTEALNVALGRGKKENIAKPDDTLDFDKDGTIRLAEYRILKMMILHKDQSVSDIYSIENVKAARSQ